MRQICLTFNEAVDRWCKVNDNGSHTILHGEKRSVKAGEIARRFAAANPDAQIGIESKVFGLATVRTYGRVVWLKHGFEKVEKV